jgi:hypothetical protein
MKILLALLILAASNAFASGPLFQHRDTIIQQEFQNVYQDIRSVSGRIDPCFSVRMAANRTNVTGDGTAYTVAFDTENLDQTSNFNTSTFQFTAPVNGAYLFTVALAVSGQDVGTTDGNLKLVTSNRTYYGTAVATPLTNNFWTFQFSGIVDMEANDTAHVVLTLSGGGKTADISAADSGGTYSLFSGILINRR